MIKNKNKILNKENYICACADFSELVKIRDFVINKALGAGFNEGDANKIALAVDEACTNLMKHSFNLDKTREFCVKIELSTYKFIIKILAQGLPFNPLQVSSLNMKEYFKNYKKGGLGIQIIRSIMDEISYLPSDVESKENVLILTKIRN